MMTVPGSLGDQLMSRNRKINPSIIQDHTQTLQDPKEDRVDAYKYLLFERVSSSNVRYLHGISTLAR